MSCHVRLPPHRCVRPCSYRPALCLPTPQKQVTYPAELAGLHYGVRPTVAGLLITAYGYSDTITTLAQVRKRGSAGVVWKCQELRKASSPPPLDAVTPSPPQHRWGWVGLRVFVVELRAPTGVQPDTATRMLHSGDLTAHSLACFPPPNRRCWIAHSTTSQCVLLFCWQQRGRHLRRWQCVGGSTLAAAPVTVRRWGCSPAAHSLSTPPDLRSTCLPFFPPVLHSGPP